MMAAKKPRRKMGLSERMHHEIILQGLSGYRVAKMAGLSESVINRWISGERKLSLDSAEKVARALGLFLTKEKK